MKNTVRVSFDVPIEEHTFLKTLCVESHIPFRNLMKKVFHKTVEELKTKRFIDTLEQGVKDVKEGKTSRLTQKDLNKWSKMVNDA